MIQVLYHFQFYVSTYPNIFVAFFIQTLITSITFIFIITYILFVNYIQLIGSDIGVYSSILHHFIFGTLPILMVNHNYLISPIFFSTEDKKSLARKAWFGLKEGKDLQLLPPQNIKFYKDIFFNIFRILGGISSFLLVSSISNRIANKYYFYMFYLKKLEWCTIIQGAKLTIHAVPLCMNLISYGYILRSYLKLVNNRKIHKNLSPEALKIHQKARNRNLVILAIVGAPLTLAILRKISGTISNTLSIDIPILLNKDMLTDTTNPESKGLFLLFTKINQYLPTGLKYFLSLLVTSLLILIIIGFNYLDLFFIIYYLKLLSYSFSTLAILYQLTNLYLLKFFSYHEFKISNMLPNILKNWLREFEALNSSLESKIEYKNECYLQITIYIVI